MLSATYVFGPLRHFILAHPQVDVCSQVFGCSGRIKRDPPSKLWECGKAARVCGLSKGCGKAGNLLLVFRFFHQPVISTASALFRSFFSFLPLVERPPEPIRLLPCFQNVRPVRDAVQQCLAQPRIRNHLRPFGKREIGRQYYRCPFRPLRDHPSACAGVGGPERRLLVAGRQDGGCRRDCAWGYASLPDSCGWRCPGSLTGHRFLQPRLVSRRPVHLVFRTDERLEYGRESCHAEGGACSSPSNGCPISRATPYRFLPGGRILIFLKDKSFALGIFTGWTSRRERSANSPISSQVP